MIGYALEIVVKELNAYIGQRTGHGDLVVLERLVDGKGDFTVRSVDRVCCSLVNMEEEKIAYHSGMGQDGGGLAGRSQPPVLVNLYLLFAVNTRTDSGSGDAYLQGLHLLSMVVSYFQGKSVLTAQNTPEMDGRLEQLGLELHPLTIENQNHLWAGLGAKYVPSVVYKLRLVALRDDRAVPLVPLVSQINLEEGRSS